jgi:ER-bound oxygenase mpaB/B'/Rubber oxygenase, catalytic domain
MGRVWHNQETGVSGSFETRLAAARHEGDPAADAVVAAFANLPGGEGWHLLESALVVKGTVPLTTLQALIEPLREPPGWLDLDLVDAGAVAYWRVGAPMLFLTLTYGSLAFGYQSADLVRPLAATGRLERMAARRLAETSRWVAAVTAPGGMHPGAEGWQASIRVRLVHALVRRHLLASGEWDPAWGVPISAAGGFATTIGGFFIVPVRAMRDLGVRFSPSEREAIAHLWRWVGYVMGVPEDLLPVSARQAEERVDAALPHGGAPTEDSPKLMRALLYHGLNLGPASPVAAQLVGALSRRWMGHEMADQLDVPGARLARLVPLVRPITRARDVVRASGLLGSDRRVARLELALVHRTLALRRAPRAPLDPSAAEADLAA